MGLKRGRVSQVERDQAVNMRNSGVTTEEIAKTLNRSVKTVYLMLEQADNPVRAVECCGGVCNKTQEVSLGN